MCSYSQHLFAFPLWFVIQFNDYIEKSISLTYFDVIEYLGAYYIKMMENNDLLIGLADFPCKETRAGKECLFYRSIWQLHLAQ